MLLGSTLAQADTLTAAACLSVLSTLLQVNDYVVTDGPIRFDPSAKSVFDLSDTSLLVVQLLVPTVRNGLRIIEGMRESGYNLDRARLICNRVGNDSGYLSLGDIGETLGLKTFASIPDDWGTVSGAINLGEPLGKHSPKSKVRAAVQKIAERLHTPDPQADENDARKKGLIGRMFAPT